MRSNEWTSRLGFLVSNVTGDKIVQTQKPRLHRTRRVASKRPHLAIICILLDARERARVFALGVNGA